MEQELGEMHWKDGWTFKRLANGDVRIRKQGREEATIPAMEWASIIHHLGKDQGPDSFERARVFHGAGE